MDIAGFRRSNATWVHLNSLNRSRHEGGASGDVRWPVIGPNTLTEKRHSGMASFKENGVLKSIVWLLVEAVWILGDIPQQLKLSGRRQYSPTECFAREWNLGIRERSGLFPSIPLEANATFLAPLLCGPAVDHRRRDNEDDHRDTESQRTNKGLGSRRKHFLLCVSVPLWF